jgi:hypothetical protein
MTSQAAPATHTTQPEDTSQGNRQLSGAGLLLARGAWLLVASFIVLFYLVGAPTRLAQLGRPLPPNRPGGLMILSQTQIDALAQVGIPLNAYIAYVLSLELLLACTCVAIGTLIFVRQSRSLAAILASIMLMAFGSSETTFMASVARIYVWLDKPVEVLQATGSGLTLIVFYTFPSGYFVPRWTRPLAWLWSAQVLAWLLVPSMPFSIVHLDIFNRTPVLSTLFVMSWSATGVYALFHRYRHVADTEQRQQMKWAVLGLLIAFCAASLSYSAPAWLRPWFADSGALGEVLYDMIARPVYWLCITLTPVCFAVAILRYRLWSIEPIINRVLVYGLLTGSLALVYIGGVVLLQAALRALTVQDSTLAVMGATLASALLFQPLRRRVQAAIDRSFDRTRVDARTALAAFTREIRTIIDLPTLLGALVQRTTDLLKITHGAVFLQQDGGFALQAAQNLPPTGTILALDDTALAELRAGVALARPGHPTFPLMLPLSALQGGNNVLIGVLVLGPRRSGQPYRSEDYDLLLTLADQAGTAISVAMLVEAEQARRASPLGQAELLAESLRARPADALRDLHLLTDRAFGDPQAAALLGVLPQVLRDQRADTLAGLAEGFVYLLSGAATPEMLVVGLRTLAAQLDPLAVRQPGAVALYRWSLAALQAETVEAVAALRQPPLPAPDTGAATPSAHLAAAVGELQGAAAALSAAARVEHADDQMAYLEQALDRLRQCDLSLVAGLAPLERTVARQIVDRWQARITAGLRALQGQARLELRLITHQLIPTDHARIALELTNTGYGPASQVTLDLLPDQGYQILHGQVGVERVEPGQRVAVQFVVEPAARAVLRPHIQLCFDDATQAGNTRTFVPAVTLLAVPAYEETIPNPYTPGTPLHSESPVFYGRADDFAFIAEALPRTAGSNPLLLTGQRRMGKTSLLQRLAARLEAHYVTVYLDGQSLAIDPGMDHFFYDIALEVADTLDMDPPDLAVFQRRPSAAFAREFLPRALAHAGGRRLLLLFDEMEELELRVANGKLDPDIFPFLRHLMQHEARLALIFAGTHRIEDLQAGYWSTFFNTALHRRIGCLDEAAAQTLITEPLAGQLLYDDLALDKILQVTGGHPYFLQLLCHTLVRDANRARRRFIVLEHINAALDQLLDLGEAHLVNLWSELTPPEQMVLGLLAAPPAADWQATADQIFAALSSQGAAVTRTQTDEAAQRLCFRDILRMEAARLPCVGAVYTWRLDLLRRWMARSQVFHRFADTA